MNMPHLPVKSLRLKKVQTENLIFKTDITYAKDKNKAHRLDRYRPKGKEAQILPVIINVHGGGLLLGNKEFNKYFCALLSKKGFLVYSMEYRLIPDCTFFDQLRDIFLAMDFVKEHAAADGGDLSHVYLVGDSGGVCFFRRVMPLLICLRNISENFDIGVGKSRI